MAKRAEKKAAHPWAFRARFRRNGFGWKSQPAVTRVKEAVSEIKQVARKEPLVAAEGAVLLIERLSPALERVDSSSGAIGTAVHNALDALTQIIAAAPADATTRDAWLDRLWEACQADDIPYLEGLGDRWGELCASKETASRWADELIGTCRLSWSPDPATRGYFKGTTHCLSALLAAGRHEELLALLELEPHHMWHYRRYGVKALAALGRPADALRQAQEGKATTDRPVDRARVCEEILLGSGLVEEAYRRYGLVANQAATYLGWFRALVKKYPHKQPREVLADLVALSPGDEGKWFAAAKDCELFDEAVALAWKAPCAPQTLARAARDFAGDRPAFAIEAGLAALHWISRGHGYEVTGADVQEAYGSTLKAAEQAGQVEETRERIREIVAREALGDRFVGRILGRSLALE